MDVVADGVVEQHGVLRHHADGGAQRDLRHVADVLAVDQDAAARDFVETKQQPRNRRLAGARRPDNGDGVPGGDLEAQAFEDRPRRLVGERDVVETDRAGADLQRLGARLVLDLGLARQHREHDLDVDHRLLDLAINQAHEIQRLVELDHHGVDHDEIADGVGAALDAVGAQHHGRGEPEREHRGLSSIEHGERDVGLGARFLVARHRAVVALALARLGGEIFHRLVVEQRIDRLGIGVGIARIHLAADVDAPFGGEIGEPHIERDRDRDHDHIAPIEVEEQHRDDQDQLDDRRRQLQQHHAHDGLDGVAAAFENARQPAGLALEMKAQRQQMHVLEGEHRQAAHRVHRHLGEDSITQLGKRRHQDAHAAVGQRHQHRRRQRPGDHIVGPKRRGAVAGQRIGCPFEGERHRDGGELGGEQQHGREDHAVLQVAPVRRPDIGPQIRERAQYGPAVGGHLAP